MSERKDQEMAPKPDPMDDAAFDRALAADLARPEDEDVALLSRAVLSALADEGPGRAAPVGEVLAAMSAPTKQCVSLATCADRPKSKKKRPPAIVPGDDAFA